MLSSFKVLPRVPCTYVSNALLRVVDVWRSGVIITLLRVATAAKRGVVGADGRGIPSQPTAELVPLAVAALAIGAPESQIMWRQTACRLVLVS